MFVTGSILLNIIVSDVFKSPCEHPKITTLVFQIKELICLKNLEVKKLAIALFKQFLSLL